MSESRSNRWGGVDDLVVGQGPEDPEKLREALEFMQRITGINPALNIDRTPASTASTMEYQTWPGTGGSGRMFESAGFQTSQGETMLWSNLHDTSCLGRTCLNPLHTKAGGYKPAIDVEVTPRMNDEGSVYFDETDIWRLRDRTLEPMIEWKAQYLLEPAQQAPGIYCKRCGHSDEAYIEEDGLYLPEKYKHLVGQPVCGNKHCLCHPHMEETYEIEAKEVKEINGNDGTEQIWTAGREG